LSLLIEVWLVSVRFGAAADRDRDARVRVVAVSISVGYGGVGEAWKKEDGASIESQVKQPEGN
jgi:hypothetical protein